MALVGPLDAAICTLKKFPAEKNLRSVDSVSRYPEVCRDRKDKPLTDVVVPIDERQVDHFIWTRNPYRLQSEPGDPTYIESPEDYLLAYWLGRYLGIVSEEL